MTDVDIRRRRMLRTALLSVVTTAIAPLARSVVADDVYTPEQFGAKGDGRSDDTQAFSALSDRVNAAGGGTVILRDTTYLVGGSSRNAHGRVVAAPLLAFKDCHSALTIQGNGALLRCREGLRFGVFDAAGQAVDDDRAARRRAKAADESRPTLHRETPYRAMISATRCTGPIEIRDITLDGNIEGLVIGGRAGDRGWQIPAIGLRLADNSGDEIITNVQAHRHALDGFYIDGPDHNDPARRRHLTGLKASGNARQGLSVVGGQGYDISDSTFSDTGRVRIHSAPAAGVDIEAERKKHIRDLSFTRCRFVNNTGAGLVADSGPSETIRFDQCVFVGSTNYSAWPKKPDYQFNGCLFVGALVNVYGDTDASQAGHFRHCVFRDDPTLSPTGQVYLPHGLCADLSHATNALFEDCQFLLDHEGVLPWSKDVIYTDCLMHQRSSRIAHTRGVFRGTTRIDGPVKLAHSRIEGTLILNGKRRH